MEKIDWAVSQSLVGLGGRSLEVPYIRRKLADVHNMVVADFGCMEGTVGMADKVGTGKYQIPSDNEVLCFDNLDAPHLVGKYVKADLLDIPFWHTQHYEKKLDIGICVSVLEHIGLDVYRNKDCPNGDWVALVNMYNTLKVGGKLIVTIPASDFDYLVTYWIRSYSPKSIKNWAKFLANSSITIDLFGIFGCCWQFCENEEEYKGVVHYRGGTDINGIACVTVVKNS